MADSCDPENDSVETQKYREAWRLFDKNDTGNITVAEFKEILNSFGIVATDFEMNKRLSEVDMRHNGVINFDEFMKVVASDTTETTQSPAAAEMLQMFRIFDPDRKGYVTKEELDEVLKKLGLNFTQKQLDLMMEYADSTGDGKINYKDFLKVNKFV